MEIPTNPDELVALLKVVLAKHIADGANSPLNALDMAAFENKTEEAKTQNTLSHQLRKDSETATESRDIALGIAKGQVSSTEGTGLYYLKSIREVLLGLYKGKEHKLGDWGFSVHSAPKSGGGNKPAA